MGCTSYTSAQYSDTFSAQYGSAIIDDVNGVISFTGRSGYSFVSGKTYRIVLIYTT